MWKWLRNKLEKDEVLELRSEVAEIKASMSGLRLDLFETLDTAIERFNKRMGVRLSKQKKTEETETTKYNDGFDDLRKINRESGGNN